MSETRITVNSRVKTLADELLHLTGVSSLSNLFAILITRYGYHLQTTWVINGQPAPIQATVQPQERQLPQTAYEQIDDPVIRRLSALIEDF
jgi:hypothetical protein